MKGFTRGSVWTGLGASAVCLFLSVAGLAQTPASLTNVAQTTIADIVLHASKALLRSGTWSVVADASAAGGYAIGNPVLGAAKLSSPLANPVNYFELTFPAYAGQPYQLWLRGKSLGSANAAVYVQFSDSITPSGSAVYRTGTSSATSVTLQGCSGLAPSGWGWHDNGWCALGQSVRFQHTGIHTVRVQVRQEGLLLDQIVLSPHRYLSSAPGSASGDSTLLSQSLPQLSTTTSSSLSSTLSTSASTSFSTSTITTSTTSVPLKVMEANISYGGHGTDNIINLTRIATWIKKMNPDVASLVEVIAGYNDPVTLTGLMKQMTGIPWYYFYVPKYPGCPEGVMILSKWKIVSSTQYYLSYQMPVAEATIDVNGKLISFFSTHFQWPKSASSERQTEANELVSFASKFAEPRIIAGDFNSNEGTPEISIIMQKYFDAWDTSVNHNTAVAYPDNPADLYTRTRKSRIDHVFYSTSATTVSVTGGQVPDQRNLSVQPVILIGTLDDKGVRPSDHNFMSIDLDLH